MPLVRLPPHAPPLKREGVDVQEYRTCAEVAAHFPNVPATGFAFVRFPVGWVGDWHPTPRLQIFFCLAGELEGETSDGVRRLYGPGTATLLADTTGTGHRARVVGDADVLAAVVQLPDWLGRSHLGGGGVSIAAMNGGTPPGSASPDHTPVSLS